MAKRSGDPCEQPGCAGHLVTYSVHNRGQSRVRYLRCCTCKHCPSGNKWIIPREFASEGRRKKS